MANCALQLYWMKKCLRDTENGSTQQLNELAVLLDDQSLVLSIYTRHLTAASNSSLGI